MTRRRSEIAISLAERGRPVYWANDDEAAVLSGMSPTQFRNWLKIPEAVSFPKVDQRNGKRRIPEILAFWGIDRGEPEKRGVEELETFG
jgi:hypothetical protein